MRRSIIVAIIGALTLTACTPEQLATWEQINGTPFTETQRVELAALPDVPLALGALTINPDGTTVENRAPSGSKCPQHYAAALRAGWKPGDWRKLDAIMWRESRCKPTAFNGSNRTRDTSYGVTQLNMRAHRSWVGPMVGWDFTRLYHVETNLRVARKLYERCGWGPWTKPYWCRRP